MINKNNPLIKFFKKRLDYISFWDGDKTKLKRSQVKACCIAIIAYSRYYEQEHHETNLIKVFGNYNSINCGLRSKINYLKDSEQKHMSSHDHVTGVKASSRYVFDLALKKDITLDNINEKIKDLIFLLIGIKLSKNQHKILNNKQYSWDEQLELKHYKDLNTVLSFVKFLKEKINEELAKGNKPLVYHKKFHSPEIVFIKNSRYKEQLKEISEKNNNQDYPLIFYKQIFKYPNKYINKCEVIQLEPSNPRDKIWNNNYEVKELIEKINKNLSIPNEHNNKLINNKKEEGAPLLV